MFKKLYLKTSFLMVFLFAMAIVGFAQERTITGKVTDASTGETLIGVNVTHANDQSQGTVTDIDGNYQLIGGLGVG